MGARGKRARLLQPRLRRLTQRNDVRRPRTRLVQKESPIQRLEEWGMLIVAETVTGADPLERSRGFS